MTDTLHLLQEVAEFNPWRVDDETGEFNICVFCDGDFVHKEDCLWVKIRKHFGLSVD